MQKLLNSILRNRTLLLFILLLALSLRYISRNQNYQRSNFLALNNAALAPFFEVRHQFFSYFKRNQHNQQLLEDNQYLLEKLINEQSKALVLDSIPFEVIPAQVIRNSIQLNYNHLTLNAGKKSGIHKEMGVISAKGVVGVVHSTNEETSSVISLLNKSLSINAKLKKSNHFGSLHWNGDSPKDMILSDVPLAATLEVGDTIVTGGMSAIFPKNIDLGVIKEIIVPLNDNYYQLHISLFQDMTNLDYVYGIVIPKAEVIKEMIIENE
ncbi:MAG: rod shape-determining protein MreC [Flavobacteriaceae bacterium]|jgi:rod shape-determining protein MreC|nr:rod shape-determining protein MreC [Flavobacteriaceae bacterium]